MRASRPVIVIAAWLWLAQGVVAPALRAATRGSASYSIPVETIDNGGGRRVSQHYEIDGSIGGIGAVASAASPATTAKSGYIGQLYEVTGLILDASPLSINETATSQLSAALLLDDSTLLALTPSTVSWSVLGGPITSVSASGLAAGGNVYQDTNAMVQGIYQSRAGTLALTVLNVTNDDLGPYANDQIDDTWQVQYFGENSPDASPAEDPDGDGHDNLFEFIAGLTPTDPASRFKLRIEPVANQPGQKNILFGPLLTGRNYTIEARGSLSSGPWTNVGSFAGNDSDEHGFTDTDATGSSRFYHVLISKP